MHISFHDTVRSQDMMKQQTGKGGYSWKGERSEGTLLPDRHHLPQSQIALPVSE